MLEYRSRRLDAVFQALSDGTRRRMLRSLSENPRSVGELAAPFQISLAATSRHIEVLERAGLIQRQIHRRTHVCHLQGKALAESGEWLHDTRQFWAERPGVPGSALLEDDRKTARETAPSTPPKVKT